MPHPRRPAFWLTCLGLLCLAGHPGLAGQGGATRRNVILFVADGLRHGSVNAHDTPALWAVRTRGRSLREQPLGVPDVHDRQRLGDRHRPRSGRHGRFRQHDLARASRRSTRPTSACCRPRRCPSSRTTGARGPGRPLWGQLSGRDDRSWRLARAHGYNTAAIGKLGPTAMQDVAAIAPRDGLFPPAPPAIVVDDATGSGAGLPLLARTGRPAVRPRPAAGGADADQRLRRVLVLQQRHRTAIAASPGTLGRQRRPAAVVRRT